MVANIISENDLLPYSDSQLPSGPYLVFAPHPDDETLGMGGTIALAISKGISVNVVFVTNGDMGGNPETRKNEARRAADVLGIDKTFNLGMGDRNVLFENLPEDFLDEIIRITEPTVIFLPSFQEIHPDHRATTQKILTFLENRDCNFDLWFYEINRQGEINRLIDISSVLDVKESAIECYASQLEQLDYKLHALCLNSMRSITLGMEIEYAEGFWCHDAGKSISPEKYYFSQVFKYLSPSGQVKWAEEKSATDNKRSWPNWATPNNENDNVHFHGKIIGNKISFITSTYNNQLRRLRDKVNNQAATLLTYFNLSNELAKDINEKTSEIEALKKINKKNNEIVKILEENISVVSLSRSHRLASGYIKSMMNLRLFFRNLRKKRFSLKKKNDFSYAHTPVSCSKSYAKPFAEGCDCCESENCPQDLTELPITDREPIAIFYSEDELDGDFREHDIYLESDTYGNKELIPLVNNKPVLFSIKCTKKNLACIDLFMATYMRVNPGILELSLYTHCDFASLNEQTPLRTSKIMSPAIMDNRFVSFEFEPVEYSDGQTFYISLSLTEGVDDKCLGLWSRLGPKIDPVAKYHLWIAANEHSVNNEMTQFVSANDGEVPDIAVVIPLFNLSYDCQCLNSTISSYSCYLDLLSDSIESVMNQSYKNWKLILLGSTSGICLPNSGNSSEDSDNSLEDSGCRVDKSLKNFLNQYMDDNRVTVQNLHINGEIANNLNQIINSSECSYLCMLEPFDTLATDALHECVKLLRQSPDTDCIYSDEDKISDKGVRMEPFFKPDWSPDLFLSSMYIGSLVLYKKDIFQKAGGYTPGFEECCEYDLLLKLSELTTNIRHIPQILYHRRIFDAVDSCSENLDNGHALMGTTKNETPIITANSRDFHIKIVSDSVSSQSSGVICSGNHDKHSFYHAKGSFSDRASSKAKKAIALSMKRRGVEAEVYDGLTKQSFRVARKFDPNTFVSIIIPFKDSHEVLETCIQSIVEKTEYKNYEIICVNNQSKKRETFLLLSQLKSLSGLNLTILDYDKPFNYSAINNYAAIHAKGDMLLFLNSDTEVISEQWLDAMLEHACRDEVGVVGAKLYYVNDTIQHAGVVVGIAGLAGHAFKHVNRYETDFYHGFPSMVRNVSAVTGACMMVRKSVFEEVGGFDQDNFKVIYNDIDLCMTIRHKGYQIIYTPFAQLYHYESYSRGYYVDPVATNNIKAKWGTILRHDPFYNPNLSKVREDWSFEIDG
ncbi:MAG: glycosyltransferase [Desulfamplus sp.]|nr:glycosyltransferase [Desulfamplus sp.]